ncbi:hypothetical protein BV20DRAFT_472708 [Pilatotrama ljubarskyi]|nr:hypothetical protein BV20DRAFT_472708 [Pilatotrama ljubarskyi]
MTRWRLTDEVPVQVARLSNESLLRRLSEYTPKVNRTLHYGPLRPSKPSPSVAIPLPRTKSAISYRAGKANLLPKGSPSVPSPREREFTVRSEQERTRPPTVAESAREVPCNDPRDEAAPKLPWHLPSRALVLLSQFNRRRPCLRITLSGRLRRSGELRWTPDV